MIAMGYKKEQQLRPHVKNFFEGRNLKIYEESPFYERRIDFVAYSKQNKRVVSVEVKLKCWQKAFQQALIYQLCSDAVYVAMPACRIQYLDKELFKENGIGFIGILPSGQCQVLIKPSRSKIVRHYYKKELISVLR